MVALREIPVGSSGAGKGSGSDSGVGQIEDWMRKFISAEIMRNIIDQTPVIFDSVKEAIVELLDSRLGAFRAEIVAEQVGAHPEPETCGSLGSFWKEDPTTSFCRLGSKVNGASCFQEGQLQDWIAAEVSRAVQEELPNTIGRITNKVVVGIERRTLAI